MKEVRWSGGEIKFYTYQLLKKNHVKVPPSPIPTGTIVISSQGAFIFKSSRALPSWFLLASHQPPLTAGEKPKLSISLFQESQHAEGNTALPS
jgi:hypothetical protein